MSEWKECKLGDIARINYGKGLPEQRRKPGSVPVFSSAGLTGWHDSPLVNNEGIIIGRKGTVGSVYYSDKPFFCIDTAYYIEPDEAKYDIKYLFYLLSTIGLTELNEDSAVPGLNRNTAYAQDILLPPLPEQRAIAGVLSSLDDKIDLMHRQNKTLEGMAEALWRKMFVEEADPEWKKAKLGNYLQIQGGYGFKSVDFKDSGEIGIIKITNISEGIVNIVDTQFVDRNIIDTIDRRFMIVSGSILIAMTGAEIGKIGIVEKTEKELWLNQRVGMFREIKKHGNILGFFALNSDEGQEHILSSATGSAQANISSIGIEDFEMPIVPDSVLNVFGLDVQPLFDKIYFNLGQIRTLSRLRDTLLPKLMSGEVRVRV